MPTMCQTFSFSLTSQQNFILPSFSKTVWQQKIAGAGKHEGACLTLEPEFLSCVYFAALRPS